MKPTAALLLALLAPSCVMHSHITELNEVPGIRGEPITYQVTSIYALHLLWIFSLVGDSSLENAIREFTKEAKALGADRIRFVQNSSTTYWFIFPPISFLVHPVAVKVEGELEGVPQFDE